MTLGWDDLYKRVSEQRRAAQESEERLREARERHAHWCAESTQAIMEALRGTLIERALEFEQRAGLPVKIGDVRMPKGDLTDTCGAPISWMSVSTDDASVGIYAVCPKGGTPRLFIASPNANSIRRARPDAQLRSVRVVSSPIGDIVERANEPALVSLDHHNAASLSYDHVAFRIFSVLVDAWQAMHGSGDDAPPSSHAY